MPRQFVRRSALVIIAVASTTLAGCVFVVGAHSDTTNDLGAVETRDFAWSGGQTLDLGVLANLTYVQGPVAKMTVTGPGLELDDLVVDHGSIHFKTLHNQRNGLTITLTAPDVDQFKISGASSMDLQKYDHPTLRVDVSGASHAKGAGRTGDIDLEISGASSADFGAVMAKDAKVNLSGASSVTLSPSGDADIAVSGAANVKLLTRPAHLTQHVSGAAHITVP